MYRLFFLTLALVAENRQETPFPLRVDPPPKEWKADEINEGLPYRWEKGVLHMLAWEVTEDVGETSRSKRIQILVLKRFDQPTETGAHRWVLAHLYHRPNDKTRPWKKDMLRIPPLRPGEKLPKLTNAEVFGHEFYKDPPTDKEIQAFVGETGWAPRLGPWETYTFSDGKLVPLKYNTSVVAGGVDRALWQKLFDRDVPTNLFPELKKATDEKE